ncbi:MAG: hypothetical protein NC412_07070 [Roseburia sp.]|nr:hypothetical protein [Roseburia sp.]MCM1279787.1 hypothetical protein [Robinsoniella sp.]
MHIIIKPHEGILVEGKLIALGKAMEQAIGILGQGERFDDTYYFEEGNIAIFVENEIINYIELRRSDDQTMYVTLDELDIFGSEKKEVSKQLASKNLEPPVEEDEYAESFKNLGISIYTGISEKDVEEMVEEAKADGVYEEMLEDIQKDMERARHVETIGIF